MSLNTLWIICVFFGKLSDALLCYRNGLAFCCSGYRKNETSGQCDKCPPGYAGPNCAYSCDYPTYGEDCLLDCACSVDLCDFRSGCKFTNKPDIPNITFTSQTMNTNSDGYRNVGNTTTDVDIPQRTTTRSTLMDFAINCGERRHRPYSRCVCNDNDPYSAYSCKSSGQCKCDDDNDCPGPNKCRCNDVIPGRYCGKPKNCRVRYARKLSYLMEMYYKKIRYYINVADKNREWIDVTEGLTPSDVLPHDWSYFTYLGSLTTPPCFETVTWINIRCRINVSKKAYKHLSLVRDVNGAYLETFGLDRPPQRGTYDGPRVTIERNFQWDSVGRVTLFCSPDRY